jgi:tripartite-type tricarboxylate transporter receptor subunit TctC
LPADIVDKLNRAVKAALNEPDVKERLTAGNTTVTGGTPAEAHAWLVSETTKWGDAVVASKRPK